MDLVDVRMVLEMNRCARTTIETPYGTTTEITLDKICKQGTVFAVDIGCRVMGRINGIGDRAVTCFGSNVEIESLVYVDDIAGGGKIGTMETLVMNCGILEVKKKASVNLDKSKWMKIGKIETAEIVTEVKDGKLEQVKEYKHLGTYINNKGDSKTNIQKRRNKGEGAYKKITDMTLVTKVGKQEIPLKLALFITVYLPTIMYNMEGWGNLHKDEIKMLDTCQANILKRLLNVPHTTPYLGILQETGIWTAEPHLKYKRIMLYHNIVHSDEKSRFVKRLIMEEEKKPFKGCWFEKVKEDIESVGLTLNQVKKELKSTVKKMVKAAINKEMVELLKQQETKKMRTVMQTDYKRKDYMMGGFSGIEVADILKTKLHMIKVKANYRDSYEDHICRQEGGRDDGTYNVPVLCTESNLIRCEFCGKVFGRTYALNVHMKMHTVAESSHKRAK